MVIVSVSKICSQLNWLYFTCTNLDKSIVTRCDNTDANKWMNEWILFADSFIHAYDTSKILTYPSPSKFKEDINNIIDNINYWFKGNSLSLDFDKTYFLRFRPKNNHEINIKISCDNKLIKETKNTEFLGLDKNSSWSRKKHIGQIMFKLSTACYSIRYVKHFRSQDTLNTIYFSYFHSILSYGIIFWGNSAYSYNNFKIQKRILE